MRTRRPGFPRRCSECPSWLTVTRPGSTCGRCTQRLQSQDRATEREIDALRPEPTPVDLDALLAGAP